MSSHNLRMNRSAVLQRNKASAAAAGPSTQTVKRNIIVERSAIEILEPPKGDAHALGHLQPHRLFHKITRTFYETRGQCFNNPDHKFHPALNTTMWPVQNETEDYIAMALAAGLMVEPDKDPFVETPTLRTLLDQVTADSGFNEDYTEYVPMTEKQMSDRWQREFCCRATIMSFPQFDSIISHKQNVIRFAKMPTEPIDHQQVMNTIERVYGQVLYPHMIQVPYSGETAELSVSDAVRSYAHDFLCVPIVVSNDPMPSDKYDTLDI